MEEEEKEEYDKAIWSVGGWVIGGFLMLADPRGTYEVNWAFAIMWWFAALLSLLRYRYRKYDYRCWMEEVSENAILVGFVIPAVIIGLCLNDPWIMVALNLVAMSIWFALWRLRFEDFLHRFWWE
jgi:hypothetical protein